MAIQRPDPFRGLIELQERVNRLFDEVVSRSFGPGGAEAAEASAFRPPVDLYEHPERYVVSADLPGVAPEDVQVTVEDGTLVLRGERKPDPHVPRDAYLRVERPHGAFAVTLTLPPSVDPDGIRARHENGVLEVTLPKKAPSTVGKIAVETP